VLFGGLIVAVTLLLPRGILPEAQDFVRRRGKTSPTGTRLADSAIPAAPPSARIESLSGRSGELLRIRAVSKRFGGVQALDDVTFDVPQGSITALIGPNGSGKTTLFNVVDGTYRAGAGSISFGGRDITKLGRARRAFLGVGRTYQLPRLFNSLTVLENVAAATGEFRLSRLARSAVSGAEAARATELLHFVGMGEYLKTKANDLSYGQRKLVELAQILMLDPAVILLDEPAAGINPTLVKRLAALIRVLNASGRTFVIVEHDMPFVMSLSEPVVALARGRVIANGTPAEVCVDPAVLDAYLGDDFVLDADPIGSAR
jgi:branched-chain amino acid transport system permease protein